MSNRVFYDLEFIEDGRTIDIISIGMVTADGRELYLQNLNCRFRRANAWVKEQVFPHLLYFDRRQQRPIYGGPPFYPPGSLSVWASRQQIAEQVVAFCNPVVYNPLELWGFYSAYDHVALCQLFGKMIDLPKGFPMWTNDIQQMAHEYSILDLDKRVPQTQEHSALHDARWNKAAWEWLQNYRMEEVA